MKKTLLALALLLGTSGVFAQIGIKTDALNTQKKANLKAEVSQRIKSHEKAALNMSKDDTRELICDFSDPTTYTFGKGVANQISDDIWKQTDTVTGFEEGAWIGNYLGVNNDGWFVFWPEWAGEGTWYNVSPGNGFAYIDLITMYNENMNNYELDAFIMFNTPLETYGKRGVDIYFNQFVKRFNQDRYFIDWSNDPNFTTYDSIEFNVRGVEMNANDDFFGVKKVTLPNGTLNANAVGATPDQLTYIRVRMYAPADPFQPHGYLFLVDDFYWSESPENRIDLVAREYYGGGYHLLPPGIVPDTLVYNVTVENTGATDYNDVVLSTELYSVAVAEEEGQPDVYTLVEGWGNNSEPDTVANTTYTGIYSINGSDTVWSAMRTRELMAYSTSLPSLSNAGTYALTSKLTSAEADFAQFLDDTTYFNVVGPMVVPEGHYQWAKDRNVLVERRDFRYGFVEENGNAKGPVAKFLDNERLDSIKSICNISSNDAVFFSCGDKNEASKLAGKVRTKLAEELNLISKDEYKFCWIIDFPLYEINEETGKLDFAHNPFSLPKGGIDAFNTNDLLNIVCSQFDCVCNGYEICSGAIRNHKPEIMYKAFELVGYQKSIVDEKFSGMITAFKYGAPPHGGCAFGIDRLIMLLLDETNLREVTAFPTNGKGMDLMMGSPSVIDYTQLRELNIELSQKAKDLLKKESDNL